MHQKKHAIIISIVLAIVSLGSSVLFRLVLNTDFLSNMFLGIFGSAFATLVIFCHEYNSEKHELIRKYCKKVDEICVCSEHIFLIEEIDGVVPDSFYTKTDGLSPIDRLCDLYIKMDCLKPQLIDLFNQFDFFLDCTFKQWFQDRIIILIEKDQKFKNRKEKRREKEGNKALYRNEYFIGKHKKSIEKRIQSPLIHYLNKIATYAQKEFFCYRNGLQVDEDSVIKGLLELQKELFVRSENGIVEVTVKWHDASNDLKGILVGSKIFWKREK